jgi:hypothetical protein
MHLSPLKLSIAAPGDEGCGWYSPTFSKKQETTKIMFSGMLAPSAKAVTDFSFVWPA